MLLGISVRWLFPDAIWVLRGPTDTHFLWMDAGGGLRRAGSWLLFLAVLGFCRLRKVPGRWTKRRARLSIGLAAGVMHALVAWQLARGLFAFVILTLRYFAWMKGIQTSPISADVYGYARIVISGLAMGAAAFIFWVLWRRHNRYATEADNAPRCEECGYNLTGNTSGLCPECGHAITTQQDGKPQIDVFRSQ